MSNNNKNNIFKYFSSENIIDSKATLESIKEKSICKKNIKSKNSEKVVKLEDHLMT
jgi:hypothetical protein